MEKKKIISGFFISLLVLLLLCSSSAYAELTPPILDAPTYIGIGVEKAHQMVEESPAEVILLDVRTEGEYDAENIPGAINIPLPDLEDRIGELDEGKSIIIYCQTGDRSREASEILVHHGFELVYNMIGGIEAWKEKFATSVATPKPTHTPAQTLSPAVTLTPSPAVSPSPSPIALPSLTPSASVTAPTPTEAPEEEKRRIPGFEASLALLILLILFRLLRRK